MKDRSDDPSHHERTLLPRSYISLLILLLDLYLWQVLGSTVLSVWKHLTPLVCASRLTERWLGFSKCLLKHCPLQTEVLLRAVLARLWANRATFNTRQEESVWFGVGQIAREETHCHLFMGYSFQCQCLLGLACTFRASCYSTHLSWAHTPVISRAV